MIRFALSALIALGMAIPSVADAACASRGKLIETLSSKFSEAPVAMGLSNSGGVVEILTSPGGDTWTIIVTTPDGMSCMIAAGESWEDKPTVKVGQGI
jgi:hypothetical protein